MIFKYELRLNTPFIIRLKVEILCFVFDPACVYVPNQDTRNPYLQADEKRCTILIKIKLSLLAGARLL